LWNGQHAFHSRPARSSFTVGAITADNTVRARSSSRKAVLSVIREGIFVALDSPARKALKATYPQVSPSASRTNDARE